MINDILNYDKNWFDFNSPTLNTHLFGKSFPDYLLDINWLFPVDLAVVSLLMPP